MPPKECNEATLTLTQVPPSAVLRSRSRAVSFDSVHVHEHVVVLGDNPSVSSGLPIALGERSNTDVMDVDEYEEYERRGRGGARVLSKADRAKLLRGTHTFFSILKAKRELKRIQKSREETCKEHLGSKENVQASVKVI